MFAHSTLKSMKSGIISNVRCFSEKNSVIFVLGAPGSGKGKHSDHLVKRFGGSHISVGEIMRETVKIQGKHSDLIKKHLNEGTLVPTDITMDLIKDKVLSKQNGIVILDGYPRNLPNYELWCSSMGDSCNVLGCLLYQCSYAFLEKRLIERGKATGRMDDNLDVIKRRFWSYEHETQAVIDILRKQYMINEICTEPPFEEAFPHSIEGYEKICKHSGLIY